MKLKVGVVSSSRDDLQEIKKSYADLNLVHSKNIVELYQTQGHQKLDAIVFVKGAQIEKEFSSYLSFLRGKQAFAKLPIALLHEGQLQVTKPFNDPSVRSYSLSGGYFLALLNFLNAVQAQQSLDEVLKIETLESMMEESLTSQLGQSAVFISQQITSDEARESFFVQKSGEMNTNLVWIKFSLRILDSGSEKLKSQYTGLSESEVEQVCESILQKSLEHFNSKIQGHLQDAGAVSFVSMDQMAPLDRGPFLKNSKSYFIRFNSSICTILMEVIRYL